MTEVATVCDYCGYALPGSNRGIPFEDDGTSHSHNRCRHLLRDDLKEARAALRELSSLLKEQGVKEWRMTSGSRAALLKAVHAAGARCVGRGSRWPSLRL